MLLLLLVQLMLVRHVVPLVTELQLVLQLLPVTVQQMLGWIWVLKADAMGIDLSTNSATGADD